MDMSGNEILQGQLNDEGRFRFAKPKVSGVIVRVILGPQHEGVFELPIETGRSGADFQ
jgi:hypothetical protein